MKRNFIFVTVRDLRVKFSVFILQGGLSMNLCICGHLAVAGYYKGFSLV